MPASPETKRVFEFINRRVVLLAVLSSVCAVLLAAGGVAKIATTDNPEDADFNPSGEIFDAAARAEDAFDTHEPVLEAQFMRYYRRADRGKGNTGTALMTLYETGAFDLDDPLTQYAPEFEDMQVYTGVDADGNMLLEPVRRPISIRDITRHTAGFPNRPNIPGLSEALAAADPLNRENTLEEMAAKFGSLPLWFQPGSQWEYGPSVDVQAFMVERISGKPYREYLQQHVLDPLGMGDTRYYVPEEDRGRFSAMYRLDTEDGSLTQLPDSTAKIEQFQHWPLARGGWGLTASLDDYMRFARMMLAGGTLDGVQVLKPETVQLMATNHLPDSVTERSWLPGKGQVGFGIDFAVRVAPPASA